MKFDINQFITELHTQFQDTLSLEEIRNLLELEEPYSKDSPNSSGKNLILTNIAFKGQKSNGDKIDYNQKIQLGINIWIADNLKGKSSILKIIKFVLTGNSDSLKKDIKKWIQEILLSFKLGNKEYSIHLNIQGRLQASFFNTTINSWENLSKNEKEPLFRSYSEVDYTTKIQDFFFSEFSYYSLKWTQKDSRKDSNDLIEAGSSWKTYFKSIFLESKDSYDLTYGSQDKKIFQMLLGLEFTYPINQLTVKRDLLNSEKGKDTIFQERTQKKELEEKELLSKELITLENEIKLFNKQVSTQISLNHLIEKYNKLLKEYKEEWDKLKTLDFEIQSLNNKRDTTNNDIEIKEKMKVEISKEIEKSEKKILELNEFVEIGVFFSNLDIQHCPSCNHSITETKKKEKYAAHQCALCNEAVAMEESSLDVENFTKKIPYIKNDIIELKKQRDLLTSDIIELKNQNTTIYSQKVFLEQQKRPIKEITSIQLELKSLEEDINSQLIKPQINYSEKDILISKVAVAKYKLDEINKKTTTKIIPNNYNSKIELFNVAILELNKRRYNGGKIILERLQNIMLDEIHEFGLDSITNVIISENFDINFEQNEEYITFKEITEGEQLRAKIAFYLSLIQLDIELNVGRHTRFLIIDSPSKEEGDAHYLEGLSGVLQNIQSRFGNQLQILIATAERGFSGVVTNEYITPKEKFVF